MIELVEVHEHDFADDKMTFTGLCNWYKKGGMSDAAFVSLLNSGEIDITTIMYNDLPPNIKAQVTKCSLRTNPINYENLRTYTD